MTISHDTSAAVAHFAGRLAFETDVADVHAGLAGKDPADAPFTLVDVRSQESWDQGHVPGAVHLPSGKVRLRAEQAVDRGKPVVTYCWGPGCNAATKAALELAKLGYDVKEMIGGFEYWVREGFAYDTASGPVQPAADPLAAPL
ncbi:rhodanese-like domain-containing protein [Promicromonospora iranensis]|uniref:Rhodanese-related sulfurtransferase n=1 Tax=Promicromonospora iranensis TaxID=1105144 RepID=A0ABU2CP53_9MICO|nr:rhodanese-like domain-containing protein [Promicromonospora iranensis]MDR7383056.1 rhodanese-related sulfurtransferase [Promicromonospora iranensis]